MIVVPAKHRPRILMIGTHLPPTVGSQSVAEGLATRLKGLGFSVGLSSRQRTRTLRLADMLFTVWRTRDSYDLIQLDVYSGAAFWWAEWVSRLATVLRKPVVLTLHGGNLPQFARRHPQLISRLFSRAAAITAPSRYLADTLQRFHGKIQVIPNPLDLGVYQYRRRDNPRPRMIWLRTFHLIYDPLSAVQVLSHVASKFPDAHLTMIGPDKDGSLAKVREEAKRLGVINQITFTGGVAKAEVPALLSTGDIFLNTATADNSPVSVLEAMASGLDIVSTNVGGMTYLIENEREGILVPPRDANAMAAAVTRLLSEPGLGARLSANSRKKAEPHDWNAVLPLWERVFADATSSPKARDA